jgi:hypothetical protein
VLSPTGTTTSTRRRWRPRTIVLGSIYGSAVGTLFEDFYNDKMWRLPEPQAAVIARVDEVIDKIIKKETTPWRDRKAGVLLWKGDRPEGQNPKGHLRQQGRTSRGRAGCGRPAASSIIRHHRLLGPRTDAEYKLDFHTPGRRTFWLVEGRLHPRAGRSHTAISSSWTARALGTVAGTSMPQQLQWYAMLFWLALSEGRPKPELPAKLAFLCLALRTQRRASTGSTPHEDDANELYELADRDRRRRFSHWKRLCVLPDADARTGARGVFTPQASDQNCRFCPYASVCPPGAKIQEKAQGTMTSLEQIRSKVDELGKRYKTVNTKKVELQRACSRPSREELAALKYARSRQRASTRSGSRTSATNYRPKSVAA